ncbi:wall-associated receptor kinase-like 8 isoform X3 [Quercus robur]|uniref:wall-associated receptor kinase-like 8 isoform X3 n=1 Tax=Quercus robur TaxID=38942 RepID=UPI0021631F7F|nr:wall-associated receptor kinase-like 8 isoform X3 [Quercus robur]
MKARRFALLNYRHPEMAVQVVMRITFLLLLTYELAEAAAPIAKPNCSDSCGNIYIPYPFGMTTGCYFNDWFKIVCKETGGFPKAFLPRIGMEVLEINITDPYNDHYFWIDPGLVRVNMPIFSSNCKNRSSRHIGGVNISGSPFFFSSNRDRFISVGCDNLALMTGINPMVVVGCKSNCIEKSMIEDSELKHCSGFNCCMTTVPSGIKVFNASFRGIKEEIKTSEECKFAFLADDKWLNSTTKDLSYYVQFLEYVPVVLEWTASEFTTLDPKELRRRNSEGYTTDYGAEYYYCLEGYQGNSYLSTGCQDINECENKTLNKCPNKSDCVNTQGSYNCNKPKSPVKMAIIVICSSLGALFLFTIIWCLYRMIKKRNKIKLKKKFFKKNGGLLLQQQLSSNDNNVQNTKLFNSKELKNATNHFNKNRILGKGGQSTVYKGMLADGRIVAIKKCNTVDKGNIEKFINEIIILSQINHRNVVKLLGWCLETEVPLLVYEFIPNGTLFQYIHEENEEFPLLTWDMRLRIATEVAGALSYLHSVASLPIYHRDIKSSNILLDDKYRVKVADFGTSRSVAIDQSHVTTLVYGTFGYLDPEYFQTSQFTEKSDVYSFGVVLVELLTGKKPVFLTRSQEDLSLSTYFIHSVKENRLFDILDTQVRKDGNKHEVMAIANLAQRCLHLYGKKRPTMTEIMMELEGVQKISPAQPNFEELDYVRNEEMGPWNDISILSSSSLEIGEPSSSFVLPLLSHID